MGGRKNFDDAFRRARECNKQQLNKWMDRIAIAYTERRILHVNCQVQVWQKLILAFHVTYAQVASNKNLFGNTTIYLQGLRFHSVETTYRINDAIISYANTLHVAESTSGLILDT